MTDDTDPRRLCEVLADADKHAEWLIARGYEVFGGCAWKKGEEDRSNRIADAVKREAEQCIAGAIWESDQRAAEADDRIQELEAAVEKWKAQSFRPLGDNHHNAALCPHCGGLARKIKKKLGRLVAAIRKHHAARGHDKCWQTDCDLYRAAGLEPGEPLLPPREEFRRRCREYEAGQYSDGSSSAAEALAAAPWAEMLAQAEAVFRNVLDTSPVIAELRAKLDALQNATAQAMRREQEKRSV